MQPVAVEVTLRVMEDGTVEVQTDAGEPMQFDSVAEALDELRSMLGADEEMEMEGAESPSARQTEQASGAEDYSAMWNQEAAKRGAM